MTSSSVFPGTAGLPAAGPRPVALVTGASSGIGAAYAARLAADGHDLVLVARRGDRLTALRDEFGATHGAAVEPLVADLADPDGLGRVAERVARGDIAFLVNNAGVNGYAPFAEVDPAVMATVNALNVTAPATLTRAVLPTLLAAGHGTVVNVASLLAFSAGATAPFLPQRVTYAAGKAYLVAFTRLLAAEVAGTGVRVQVCCPGVVATEFHDRNGGTPRVPAMAAGDVVTASLAALAAGEAVCAPGLADPAAVDRLTEAEAALMSASGAGRLAPRYAEPGAVAADEAMGTGR